MVGIGKVWIQEDFAFGRDSIVGAEESGSISERATNGMHEVAGLYVDGTCRTWRFCA